MADYAGRWTVSQTAGFQQRTAIAVTAVAVQYTSEQGESFEVDRKRRALAVAVFADPAAHMERFAMVLASQDLPVDATDDAIWTAVFQVWDNLAGINTDDYP